MAVAGRPLKAMAREPIVLAAIAEHNISMTGRDVLELRRMAGTWRRELYRRDRWELVDKVLDRPASHYLRVAEARSGGLFSEIFVLDRIGIAVAASRPLGIYWHADRPRWLETLPEGRGAIHFGPPEFNDALGAWQQQVAMTVSDPVTDRPEGVICASVVLDAL